MPRDLAVFAAPELLPTLPRRPRVARIFLVLHSLCAHAASGVKGSISLGRKIASGVVRNSSIS